MLNCFSASHKLYILSSGFLLHSHLTPKRVYGYAYHNTVFKKKKVKHNECQKSCMQLEKSIRQRGSRSDLLKVGRTVYHSLNNVMRKMEGF